jgi:hypothetical protein
MDMSKRDEFGDFVEAKHLALKDLRAEINEGLEGLAEMQDEDLLDGINIIRRYLQTPGNHVSNLFKLADLSEDNIDHWKILLWYVSSPLYHHTAGRSADTWSDSAELQLLLHASIASAILSQRLHLPDGKPSFAQIAAEVFTLPEYKRTYRNRKQRSKSSIGTAIHRVTTKYSLRMKDDAWRQQYDAEEIEGIEMALDRLRPKWRSKTEPD